MKYVLRHGRCFWVPAGWVLLVAGWAGTSQAALTIRPSTATQSYPITTNRVVVPQARRTYAFPQTAVFVDNTFDGARLNGIQQTGPGTYTATIQPENSPINDSAWYAFKIWSPSNQTVEVVLTYEHGKHRYQPKISPDALHWEKLGSTYCTVGSAGKTATLSLPIGPRPLFVAGQELFTSRDFKQWSDALCRHPFVRSQVLGLSPLGKPLIALELTETGPDAEYLLLLGRQHPPEQTGTIALCAFVENLCQDTPLALRFRRQFKVFIVPLVNPDGVDAGHWRHNSRGVDLNRDWGQFNQVETRLIRDALLRLQKAAPGKLRFGLDFHSTSHDVFYSALKPSPGDSALERDENPARKWFARMQELVPEYDMDVEENRPHGHGDTVTSIGWMRRVLNIPAVTYEVGDQTDRELIRKVAANAAQALMELLLAKPAPQPALHP